MIKLAGRPGTWGGLTLRTGQVAFAAACICVMSSAPRFINYTAFWYRLPLRRLISPPVRFIAGPFILPQFGDYLIASMGLQAVWSLGLACLDCYALILKKNLQRAVLMSLFVVGDWTSNSNSFVCCSVLSRRCSCAF
ncbi:hypothetical protein ACP70R_036443 [Stipagrostis hirtigluma subsp. patula]